MGNSVPGGTQKILIVMIIYVKQIKFSNIISSKIFNYNTCIIPA